MSEIHPRSLGRFVRAAALLAAPARDQLDYLAAIGLEEGVDDLALDFDDGRLPVRQFVELGRISASAPSGFNR